MSNNKFNAVRHNEQTVKTPINSFEQREYRSTTITVVKAYNIVLSTRELESVMRLISLFKQSAKFAQSANSSLSYVLRKEYALASNAYMLYCKRCELDGLPIERQFYNYIEHCALTLTAAQYDELTGLLLELSCLNSELSQLYSATSNVYS